jgi:hypothetical protein
LGWPAAKLPWLGATIRALPARLAKGAAPGVAAMKARYWDLMSL